MVASPRGGFTLVEAMVALTLSSVLVILVSTVFLVQNQYYAITLERSAVQDNARMTTEMVASEIRSVMKGGVERAENKRLVVRSPMVLAAICGFSSGNRASVQMSGGDTNLTTSEVGGVALRSFSTGAWTYRDASWSDMHQSGQQPARDCFTNGADTVGALKDFHSFRRFNNYFGSMPPLGSIVMFYRRIEYRFAASALEPGTTALFRGPAGGTLLEFVTGMDATAQFLYRTGGTSYATSVGSGSVDNIDAIRIEAQARRKPQTGGVDDVTFGWGVNIHLRNRR